MSRFHQHTVHLKPVSHFAEFFEGEAPRLEEISALSSGPASQRGQHHHEGPERREGQGVAGMS
jgi:hypothetical protein